MMYENLYRKVHCALMDAGWDLARCNDAYRLAHILSKLTGEFNVLTLEAEELVKEIEDASL